MITMESIASSQEDLGSNTVIGVALAIDGRVVYTFNTFIWFYDLLTTADTIVEADLPAGKRGVSFIKDNSVVETLECTEMFSALLRSDPQIVEIVREPLPPEESLGLKRYVDIGWNVSESGEFIPPSNWTPPVKTAPSPEALKKYEELRAFRNGQ